MDVDIIIKAFNEQRRIEACIRSAISAHEGMSGKIMLVDSRSTDDTVKIASQYPITILEVPSEDFRRCGAGPQIGFLNSSSAYICIIDADMILDKDFIRKAINEMMQKDKVAGVSGILKHVNSYDNILVRSAKKGTSKSKTGYVDSLVGAVVYKRKAIEDVGFLSNPYLYANEESDLGYRLTQKGYRLVRIPILSAIHFIDSKSALQTLRSKWKSRYMQGPGQVLRYNMNNKLFFRHLLRLRVYVFSMIFWTIGAIMLLLSFLTNNGAYFISWIIFAMLLLFFILMKKRFSIKELVFSIISWNMTAFAMIKGFLRTPKKIEDFPREHVKKIKG